MWWSGRKASRIGLSGPEWITTEPALGDPPSGEAQGGRFVGRDRGVRLHAIPGKCGKRPRRLERDRRRQPVRGEVASDGGRDGVEALHAVDGSAEGGGLDAEGLDQCRGDEAGPDCVGVGQQRGGFARDRDGVRRAAAEAGAHGGENLLAGAHCRFFPARSAL